MSSIIDSVTADMTIPEDLIDPITGDLLEDPITVPCCGRAFSRNSLIINSSYSTECSMCRGSLKGFDPQLAPKSITVANMIDHFMKTKKTNVPEIIPNLDEKMTWHAKIIPVQTANNGYKTKIGRLMITNSSNKMNFKTLIVPIVDKSGSMSGKPINQVKYSLKRIIDLTYKNSHLVTTIIPYADTASEILININLPQSHHDNTIDHISDQMGGTNFSSAFQQLLSVCDKYNNVDLISSLVVVFLTDGEDSSIGKNNRAGLADKLKADMAAHWSKIFTIHTVGFGQNHDFDFLNYLRTIGTVEGAYRYANPNDDDDILSMKINSIIDVITQSSVIPIKVLSKDNSLPLIDAQEYGKNKYWVNMTKYPGQDSLEYDVEIDGKTITITTEQNPIEYDVEIDGETNTVAAQIAHDESCAEINNEWITYLIDQIANELLPLSVLTEKNGLDKQIHCEILLQRARAISVSLEADTPQITRLATLVSTIKSISQGKEIDQMKLNDMKSEGKFATAKTTGDPNKQGVSYRPAFYNPNFIQPLSLSLPMKKLWETIPYKRSRCVLKKVPELFTVLRTYKKDKAHEWIESNKESNCFLALDENGANALIHSSSIKRCDTTKVIFNTNKFDLDAKDSNGYNALDMACYHGCWLTVDFLLENGAKFNLDCNLLLRSCLSKGFFNTAYRLVKHKFVVITDDMIENAPNNDITAWLSKYSQKDISYEVAIMKGMYDVVVEKLNQIPQNISMKPYIEIFTKTTNIGDYCKIVDFLILNKKFDPCEVFDIVYEGKNVSTWPLYNVCEKGNQPMFKVLLKYCKTMIDYQNSNGTTCLWIASCNKHVDIVAELLANGAGPNICDFEGNNPLIPTCRKGAVTIVEMLLEANVSLDGYNKERDNAILMCCRTGQAEILELLLNTFKNKPNELKKLLRTYAEIDGFAPMFAATELDKTSCIRVCHKFDPDLINEFTSEDNKVLPGGTAVHLACHYGRLASLNVLKELGAKLTTKTIVGGFTPLHIAIKNSHLDVVGYLLSLPEGKSCMTERDDEGRLPAYYAGMNGNESILQEFFVNKLALLLEKSLFLNNEIEEKKCADVLTKYGSSLGFYEHDQIMDLDMGRGSNLLSMAILNGNNNLISDLMNMGARFDKPDEFGVTPAFWSLVLDLSQISNMKLDEQSVKLFDRVRNISKQSLQNKMLLSVKQGIPLALDDKNALTPLIKMSDGYDYKVNKNTLQLLKKSKSEDHSLLGFLEKIKSNTVIPNAKESIPYVLWDAKIHLIRTIASLSSSDENHLEPIHIMALYLYTSNPTIFYQVNKTLVNWENKNYSIWHPYINCLYQAIDLLPKFTGEVYRAIDYQFGANPNGYQIGTIFNWNTFSIASKEFTSTIEMINNKRGIVFIIKSKTGRLISRYSKSAADNEVIFLPESRFEITNHYQASIICLSQANIRSTTFGLHEKNREAYMNKVFKQEASIIIELTEVANSFSTNVNDNCTKPIIISTIEEI